MILTFLSVEAMFMSVKEVFVKLLMFIYFCRYLKSQSLTFSVNLRLTTKTASTS